MENIRNKNILIVDDDEYMLRALDKTLAGAGALVTSTQWAGDAVEILISREKSMHMVITDLRMPLVNGLTLVYAIHLMFPSVPVVVLTAYGSPDVGAECLRQGAAVVLEKNLDSSQLLVEIKKVLTRQELGVSRSSRPQMEAAADRNINRDDPR